MSFPSDLEIASKANLKPLTEIAANAGILLTEVQYLKESEDKNFAIVDAAMNDLIRPALYSACQDIIPVIPRTQSGTIYDVVGPVCESGDVLAKGRWLPETVRGDLICTFSAGAYGMTMSSNYNSRPRGAEVLVNGGTHRLIRRRETYEELVANEIVGS